MPLEEWSRNVIVTAASIGSKLSPEIASHYGSSQSPAGKDGTGIKAAVINIFCPYFCLMFIANPHCVQTALVHTSNIVFPFSYSYNNINNNKQQPSNI